MLMKITFPSGGESEHPQRPRFPTRVFPVVRGGLWQIAAAGALAVWVAAEPVGEGDGAWFPFAIPVLADQAPAFDLRGLNEKVAGENGWLRADGERFADERGGTFRIFGTNLTAEACFPDEAQAGPLARHLARFGYNMVRLHFLDNQWGPGVPTLTPQSNNVARDGLRPDSLAKLDRFTAELRAAGVRINMNLHVGRHYPGWSEGLPPYSKGLDYFMPGDVSELKAYCRALLTHVNPHTGLAYKDDPAVSVLEISNEDSLVSDPGWLGGLPEPCAGELRRQWVEWLRAKHRSTDRLRERWGIDTGPFGPEVAPPLTEWRVENHEGAQSTVRPLAEGGGVRWDADKAGVDPWHLQFESGRTRMESGKCYTIRFRARSTTGNVLGLYYAHAGGDWRVLGLNETLSLASDWKSYVFRVAPGMIDAAHGARLVFSLRNRTGSVEIDGFSCREASDGYLKPEQTLEKGDIPFALAGAPEKVRGDAMAFLADVEIRFASGIRDYLKKDLGCRALVAHSQVCFGGPLGARREQRVSDFVDTHGYWQHPHWPNKQWDPNDWLVDNSSQIATPDGGTLAGLATQRPHGKPFTVSEYDLPAPSDYAAEMWPMFAAMAGFQGWAGIYHYTFGHGAKDMSADRITGHFNGAAHPAKDGLRPAAALMFRLGLVGPARQRFLLSAGEDDLVALGGRAEGHMWSAERVLWNEKAGTGSGLALRHATGMDIRPGTLEPGWPGAAPTMPAGKRIESDTGEWLWDHGQGFWVLNAPAARAWSGLIGGRTLAAGDASLRVPALSGPVPHATVVLVATDGKPLAESRRLLLTAMRRAENPGMVWNRERKSLGRQWGGGPVRVLGLDASLKLPAGADWKVTPLDIRGQRGTPETATGGSFEIHPASRTIWWLLER